jgi:S-DNA-T family DNA segregation ATPase FtsK/SpoIIIE
MKAKKGRKTGLPAQKAAANRKSGAKKERKPVPYVEIAGVLLVFLAVIGLLSLIGFHDGEAGLGSASTTVGPGQNLAGRVGAFLARALLEAFGLLAFIVPLFLGYVGVLTFIPVRRRRVLVKTLLTAVLITLLAAVLSLIFSRLTWRGAVIRGGAGGGLGAGFAAFLGRYIGPIGAFILLLVALLLFTILTTSLTFGHIGRFFRHLFGFAGQGVRIKIDDTRGARDEDKGTKPAGEGPDAGEAPQPRLKGRPTPAAERPAAETRDMRPGKTAPLVIRKTKTLGPEQLTFPEMDKKTGYQFPPLSLLDPGQPSERIDKDELMDKKRRIEEKLHEFRVDGEVRECHPGPVITTYEFYPDPGIKVSQVASRDEDLSLALGAESVRIQRIPGKTSLGIEIPNNKRELISLRDILQSDKFINSPSKLTLALGKTVHDEVYVTDLAIMPHLLIAGATGSGKSVGLNAIIASILYKATPDEVKFILIDPKRLEFALYDNIPHLLSPVITDPRKAGAVLMDAIRKMEERYHMLHQAKVRTIEQYNQQMKLLAKEHKGRLSEEEAAKLKPLPFIVIIIDELAELMMVGAQDVEYCITRLAQLARAVGIHLVMATQRPSIDVITGTIKNNFSSRIAFRVPSKIDSRIILDAGGAEKLLGLGDMLFIPPNFPRLTRLHSAFISIPEVRRLTKFVKEQGIPDYDQKIVSVLKATSDHFDGDLGEKDELYEKAVELVLNSGQASVSYLQRRMKLGYARAARIIDQMEQEGILGASEGSKPREILVDPKSYQRKRTED